MLGKQYACPVTVGPRNFVWVDLKSMPSNTPMDLVSFYDRSSGLQFAAWVALVILALAGMGLIVERSINYNRASRQTRQFMSLVGEALVYGRPDHALPLASHFPASPVACVVNASLKPGEPGECQFSTAARNIAATAKTADVVRGLATLSGIAMTTPIIGAAAAIEGLIRCLRVSSVLPISADVLQNLVADWMVGLLAALGVAFVATWAHRLLCAKATRLLVEMDRLSLATISRIMEPAERPRTGARLLAPQIHEIGSRVTRGIGN